MAGVPDAKEQSFFHRRNLPHFQGAGGPLYVTFCTRDRWALPAAARAAVLRHCLHDHGSKMILHCAVVMPDHVHLIYQPLQDSRGVHYGTAEIVGGLKGAAAHAVNGLLKRKGPVWQRESFDRVLRSDEQGWVQIEYAIGNPVRKALCQAPEDYLWMWVNPDLTGFRGVPDSVARAIRRRNAGKPAEVQG